MNRPVRANHDEEPLQQWLQCCEHFQRARLGANLETLFAPKET